MFVSLRYNEVDAGHHLDHYGQYLQQYHHHQQQQQQHQYQCPTAADWTLNTPSYSQHFPYSSPVSTSTYLDYCNAVLPACSWYQHSNNTASTLQSNDGDLHTSCSSVVGYSLSGNVNSTCYDNSRRRRVHDDHPLSGVHHVTDTPLNWYTSDKLNSQLLMSTRSQPAASSCQYQNHAQRSEFHEGASSEGSSELVNRASNTTTQSTDVRHRPLRRTKDALVPLIIRAILSAAETRLSLADICRYIEQHSIDYATSDDQTRWQNNVRHTLSHYEFFVKCGRVPTGRGNYWTIHPVCRAAFAADDFRIKRARHAVQLHQKSSNFTSHRASTYTC